MRTCDDLADHDEVDAKRNAGIVAWTDLFADLAVVQRLAGSPVVVKRRRDD